MAVYQTPRTRLVQTVVLALALLGLFWIASYHLSRESLAGDEGYSLWFIRDNAPVPDSLSEGVRYVRDSLLNTFALVRTAGVHPPLYYLTLDMWTMLTGESLYAVRLYSALCGLIGMAATYAVGRRLLKDFTAAVMAILIVGTASFFVYYTREARMYTLLLALSALSMRAYLRWQHRPTLWRILIYGVLMAALMYTHYVGVFVILAQLLHRLVWGKRSLRLIFPYALAAILFAPWLPFALAQYRIFGRPGGLPLTTDLNTVAALWVLLTNGYGWVYIVLLVAALIGLRQRWPQLSLLLLWVLLLPAVLLLVNLVHPVFQIRYVLPILPAFALLLAWGIKNIFTWRYLASFAPLRFIVLLGLLYLQVETYSWFWPNKPDWETTVQHMTATRELLEPAITSIPAHNPTAYYDRLYHIRQGIALDLAWRWQEATDMRDYVERLHSSSSVWVVMPSSFASTWDAATALLADGRHVGYRDTLMDMIFYRFDRDGSDENLQFRFGDALAWTGGIGHQLYARAGEPFCFDLHFQALQPIDASYTVDLALTQGYGTFRAGQSLTLEGHNGGEQVDLPTCIDMPADNPAGPHHLRMRVLHNGQPLPVLEAENLYWGETLMPALVTVE